MSQDELNENSRSQQDSGGGDLESNLAENGDESFVTEEKKPVNRSTLVLFGIILAGIGGYYLMYVRGGPSKAAAATAEAAAADQTIKQFLTDNERIKSMERMLRSTEKVVEQFKSYPS